MSIQYQLEKIRISRMITEMLHTRYVKICEENNMCFNGYQTACYEAAKKVILNGGEKKCQKKLVK